MTNWILTVVYVFSFIAVVAGVWMLFRSNEQTATLFFVLAILLRQK